MNVVSLNEQECRTIVDKINVLTAAVHRAIAVLDDPWSEMRHRTAQQLRELLEDMQSSGNPGQLSDGATDEHDVNWGPCPKCGCTDLAFIDWPHGRSKDVLCGDCGWQGVYPHPDLIEPPRESV